MNRLSQNSHGFFTNNKITLVRLLALGLMALTALPLLADDTEIYTQAAANKPMVLIIMDNSGSMADPVPYDVDNIYPGTYVAATRYKNVCTARNKRGTCTAAEWQVYAGAFTDNYNSDSGITVLGKDGIDDNDSLLKTGNRLNYEAVPNTSKISMAKGVLNNLVDLMYDQVDFGFMKFNQEDGGNLISKIGATKTAMHGQISAMNASTWTPLAETLATAGMYFEDTMNGQFSPLDCNSYCRKAFIVLITDGEPTHDTKPSIIGHFLDRGQTGITDLNRGQKWDQNGDYFKHGASVSDGLNNDVWVADNLYSEDVPQTFLDDVAKYLYSHDLRPDLQGTQNLTTYTIGFLHDSQLLRKTAAEGGGLYFTANSAAQLQESLLNALDDITKKMQTYTAPVVPVTRSSSGDKMYLAFFKPLNSSNFWNGDLQKYSLSTSNQILDAAGNPATDTSGAMLDTAVPIWSAERQLHLRSTQRNIYTVTGGTDLTSAANAFTIANAALTAAMLGDPVKQGTSDPTTTARADIINYIRGNDAYDDNVNGAWAEVKEQVLGDVLHSVPLVIDYAGYGAADPKRFVYFGANDGMLHAIDDTDGSESWGFIPPELLPQLKQFPEDPGTHPYFVDGSAKALVERNGAGVVTKALLVFGLRNGGGSYTIIDVTDPLKPVYIGRITSGSAGFAELGNTWSDPVVGYVHDKNGFGQVTKYRAMVIGAGFDPGQADDDAQAVAATGRGVFVVNLETGALLRSFVHSATNGLDYAVPSQALAVDRDFDGNIDRIYIGDLGGNLWRIGGIGVSGGYLSDWQLRRLFSANPGADATSGRKFFYAPDIALGADADTVLIGSGDRDNPRSSTAVSDRIYGVRDTSAPAGPGFATVTETIMTDRTLATVATSSYAAGGWYAKLGAAGEKSLASPVLFNGFALFTSFIPNSLACDIGGNAKLYAMKLAGGLITKYDLGNGIPTEPTLVVRASGTTAFAGAGSGVVDLSRLQVGSGSPNSDPISSVFKFPAGIRLTAWREVF